MLLALVAGGLAAGPAVDTPQSETESAYLLNLLRYASWPEDARQSVPLVVTLIQTPADAAEMAAQLRQAGSVHHRSLEVRVVENLPSEPLVEAEVLLAEALNGSHAVFVGESHGAWAQAISAFARQAPLLTVGVGAEFVRAGGMIAFREIDGRIAFTCNFEEVRVSQVSLSSRLLALSRPLNAGDVR